MTLWWKGDRIEHIFFVSNTLLKGEDTIDEIAELWRRIDIWFETFAPAYANAFFPGATEEDLVEAEAVLGVTLPTDFKASYRIHNGSQCNFVLLGYPDFYQLSTVYLEGQAGALPEALPAGCLLGYDGALLGGTAGALPRPTSVVASGLA